MIALANCNIFLANKYLIQASWTISAVIYRSRYGNYKHWALCTENGETSIIYEVIGQHGTFQRSALQARPENSTHFLEAIYLGEVANRDFKVFENTVTATEVDNETVEWDCQDYVLEILHNLEEECIIDGDDKTYQKQKRKLRNKRGEY